MCQILRDSSVTALQQQRAASVLHQAFPPPRPHRGAPLQLRSATVESWRLGLTAHAVGQVFWSPGPPPFKSKSYIYPTTLDGKKFRMDRIAVCTSIVPSRDHLLPFCQLYSVDQAQDLSELVSTERYAPWLRAFTALNVERFYCLMCNPTLPECVEPRGADMSH
jgi:hypothetical protein